MLVGLAARQRVGKQRRPSLEVGALRWYLAGRHHVIFGSLDDERDEALAQLHADSLEVLGFVTVFVWLERLLPAPPATQQDTFSRYLIRYAPVIVVGHAEMQADVEG